MRRYSAFEEPGTFLHRLATKPIRPIGDATRKASDALTDIQPIVAQFGDKAVDAFTPAIEAGAKGLLEGASQGLAAMAPSAGFVGASAGETIGGALGAMLPGGAGAVPGAAAGAGIGGALGTGLAGAASLGAKALEGTTPALSKLAAPALKAGGRLAYHGLNDAVDSAATAMGSYDDNPATSRGLRALNNAQNPITDAKPSSFSGFAGGPGPGAKQSAMSNLAKRPEMPGVPPQPQPFVGPPRNQKVIDDNAVVSNVMDQMFSAPKPTAGGRSAPAPRRQDWGNAKNSVPSQGLGTKAPFIVPERVIPEVSSSDVSSSTPGTASSYGMPPPAPSSAVNTDMRKLVMAQQLRPGFSGSINTEDSAAARLPEMPMPSTRGGMSGKSVNDAGAPPVPQFTSAVDSPMKSLVRGGNTMSNANVTDELQQMTFREPMGFDPVDVGIDYGLGGAMKVGASAIAPLVRRVGGAAARAAGGAALDSRATQTAAKAFDDFAAGNGSIPRPVSMPPQQAPRPVSMPPQGPNGTIPGAQWDAAATMRPGPRPVSMPPQPGGSTIPGTQWDKAATQVPGPRPVSMAPQGGRTVPGSQWDTGATMRPRASTTIPDLSATVPPPGRVGPRPTPAPSPEQGQISSLLRRPSAPPQEVPLGPMPPAGPDQGFDLYDVTRWSGRGKDLLDQALRDNPGMMTRMSKDSVYAQQVLEHFEALGHKTGY